jgi:hypothetical protein
VPFSPNEIPVFVPSNNVKESRAWLSKLRQEGNVLLLARNRQDLEVGAEPGVWTLLAPTLPALYDEALRRAAEVYSPDPKWKERANALRLEAASQPPATQNETFAFCCVADSQYVPFFFALLQNLRKVHSGPLEVHFLAVDALAEDLVRAELGGEVHFYRLETVWEPEELDRILARPVSLRALSSKARLLLRARENSSAEALFLLDLDMYFFRSPAHLNQAFGDSHTLLFPQWSDRFTWARLHGVFNSGMVGARKGSETLLSWWSKACWISCELDVENGRFGDQAFIDHALCQFTGVRVYKGHDEDVAPWNSETLGVRWESGRLVLQDGKPVGSFHAAGPDALRVFELKYTWDQLMAVFSVIGNPNESSTLFRNTIEQQRLHWPELDRAMRVRELLEKRTFLPVAKPTRDWAVRAVSPSGQRAFSILDFAHSKYRSLRSSSLTLASGTENEYDLWVKLQRKVLDAQRG